MIYRIASASAKPTGRAFVTVAATAIAVVFAVSAALAQQPRPKPGAKPQPAQKPAAQQAAPAAQQPPQLIYSPWTKFCQKGKQAGAKELCITGMDARIESGQPVVAAVLIEPEGEPRKLLRVTVPLGVQLRQGTRVIIDKGTPLTAGYSIFLSHGCFSDYQANADLVAKLKKGKVLTIQAINFNNVAISLPLPLDKFAKANEGPPIDPKTLEQQQQKLQAELRKRAEEARKKLEIQKTPPAAPKPAK